MIWEHRIGITSRNCHRRPAGVAQSPSTSLPGKSDGEIRNKVLTALEICPLPTAVINTNW